MVISMSQPWKHPKTGVWYLRERVPADLKDKLKKQKLTVRVAGSDRTVTPNEFAKVSLGTKERSEAKLRHASVQTQVQERWAAARKAPEPLSHEEIHALAGVAYRDLVAECRANPGKAEDWEIQRDLWMEPFVHLDETSDGETSEPYNPKRGMRELSKLVDLDEFLGARGLSIDEPTRFKLIQEIAYARVLATYTLERFASSDYSDDGIVKRFPDWQPKRALEAAQKGAGGPTLWTLMAGWAKEAAPKQATLDLWKGYLAEFVGFIGHQDARSVRRADVIAWKQKLLDDGNSVKTINDSKLAALKRVLGWAVDNELLTENPAARVSVKRSKKAGQSMLGFSQAEAATILRGAEGETSDVYRWVPLLCASSGARVSEVCQLRAEDVAQHEGVWIMHFKADAGSLKTPHSERRVPLHPHVVAGGFLEFVHRKGRGPLFFDPKRRKPGAKKPPPKIVAKNVAAWVHRLGIEVGRKHRKDPNHG